MEEKTAFLFYREWCGLLLDLDDSLRHRTLDAVLRYALNGEEPTDRDVRGVFGFIKLQIDRDTAKWLKNKRIFSEAGKKAMERRWGKADDKQDITPNKQAITKDKEVISKDKQVITTLPEVITTDNIYVDVDVNVDDNVDVDANVDVDDVKENVKENKRVRAAFSKPTLTQVTDEMDFEARKNGVTLDPQSEAQAFLDYYESNGWHVGRNHMKNWQAAVRGWIRRSQTSNKPNNYATSSNTAADNIKDAQLYQLSQMAATLRAAKE